ncbi:PEP/pyruvate-binding domain-containing protein [Lacinutrix sp. 5H-3-7-4]|uniref:PEP/pyruvate-binding domain-containing protein n=1 Tax=Lacinutrix sp. (strain 5H-3-7-4) TaxID=983544 RepID=UPI00020A3546|nr:PEP/pyruvate-binding domain-containing protein [Lacinutrix sp. 5H-3-7-4]AEH02298.1 pyruvate phosphate dikinase PEP/pyruvate-binding protein [Lacinutrix sp. 5H-3-7-4]
MLKNTFFTFILFYAFISYSNAQQRTTKQIKNLIETYKNDPRGPYHRIKWFCKDGTEREPRDPCPDDIGGGIQHAAFKTTALDLRKTNNLYFGEIIAALEPKDFLDHNNNYSRLKQYQLGKYLASVDNGWVLQKAQFYRGAIQSEDEEAWGKDFFEWLLKDEQIITSKYYLLRQALKDIPHNGDDNIAQLMRSQSKTLSEDLKSFMDIRIKIHGQPEVTDIKLVKDYIANNTIPNDLKKGFDELVETMYKFYSPIDFSKLEKELNKLPVSNPTTLKIKAFITSNKNQKTSASFVSEIASILTEIRENILSYKNSKHRLQLLDLSNQLEHTLLTETQNWQINTVGESLDKINALTCAAMGTGLIEIWEYNAIENTLNNKIAQNNLTLYELNQLLTTSRSVVEWSASTVKANYQDIVGKYTAFEPLSYGFIDDRIRSSIALNLGETVSLFGAFIAKTSHINNSVMAIENQSAIRGLNPGYAYGELVVVDGNPDNIEVNTNKIYIFEKPPHDLKPVAGIMTVSEGNLVSHVQLLARNLGIPNAALSYNNLKELKKHNGETVFYAVSNKGNVILKTEDDMSSIEKKLFNKKERNKNVIAVPVDQIRLDVSKVINMRDVDASDSGKLCGPKAANLGALKKMFPKQVVEGIIIPFGIFRTHMDQQMPNQNKTYWQYLNSTFNTAKAMREANKSDEVVEKFQLDALEVLHKAIINMPLEAAFLNDMKSSFASAFGDAIGNVPVFLRSDTNMEDLKEFTGAGLNLTLFNIKAEDEIIKGIKRVWASAYTERSFKWRQKYLSNPENVFPSILIIPSVDVDYSGVMITKGINSGNDEDLTVAFSRGAGGAVDGQSAETRLITSKANVLLAPARQSDYIRLPDYGGTKQYTTSFETPILNQQNIKDIRTLASEIRKTMAKHNDDAKQAYDVEFGFKNNKLWLFQIRPFVENKQAKSSEYLSSIAPNTDSKQTINLSEKL